MSQMLARLGQRLETAAEPLERDEIGARLAIGLARLGRFGEAQERIVSMRSEYGAARGDAGTLWIMLAEGVIELYRSISPAALDRITRAHALARALNYQAVVALASAWKAHIEFERSDFQAMTSSLALAMQRDSLMDLDVSTRVAIVLSNAFAHSGDFDQSYRWFAKGREAAVSNGDQASIEALQYNRAALRLAWLRVERCRGSVASEDLKSIRVELGSAKGLQRLMQVEAYVNHLHLCDARLSTLEEDFERAIIGLRRVRSLAPFAENNFSQELIDAEIAYCQALGGHSDEALALHRPLTRGSLESLDLDDRLVACWMQSVLSCMDVRFLAPENSNGIDEMLEKLDASRTQLRAILKDFELQGVPA